MSSSCVPHSTSCPSLSTPTLCARLTVLSRCATSSVVRPLAARSSASVTARSLRASNADVASSRSNTAGSASNTRAIAMRCRCPPLSPAPRSPTRVSYPSGNRDTNSCAFAGFRRRDDLLAGGVWSRVGDVLRHRPGEKGRILTHRAHVSAKPARIEVGDANRVDEDVALRRVVETLQQRADGGFASAAGSDQREHLARGERQVESVEDHAIGSARVREAHVAELDGAAHRARER